MELAIKRCIELAKRWAQFAADIKQPRTWVFYSGTGFSSGVYFASNNDNTVVNIYDKFPDIIGVNLTQEKFEFRYTLTVDKLNEMCDKSEALLTELQTENKQKLTEENEIKNAERVAALKYELEQLEGK